jgi:magnesium and cobalt transporter
MAEDSSGSLDLNQPSWLERISQIFSGDPRDRKELVEYLQELQKRNLFNMDALAMIEGVLQVSEMQVREIMIPRSQMVVCKREHSPEELLPVLLESGHSRFPVIGENRDEVIGILLAKDMLHYFSAQDKTAFDLREVMRPAYFVPESKRLDVLLKDFRANRNHMAIIVDEYGGVSGLVTIEDVLEQIVGEIDDEHDFGDDTFFLPLNDQTCTVKALTPIEDFNSYFGTEFSDEEFDTIGGLLVKKFGRLPARGETMTIDNLLFKVVRSDIRRVHLLTVSTLTHKAQAQAASPESSS